jgi:hypothetical protein
MADPGDADRRRAEDSVALQFSRIMKATTSPWGILTDPPVVALVTAVPLIITLAYRGLGDSKVVLTVLEVITVMPIVIALVVHVALSGARRRVIDWLATLPFPLGNLNAVLNGVGEELEIEFEGPMPDPKDLNHRLDRVHPDCFVTSSDEANRIHMVRIGIVDSKRNPAKTNHQRYRRLQALSEQVLRPLSEEFAIRGVRVQ